MKLLMPKHDPRHSPAWPWIGVALVIVALGTLALPLVPSSLTPVCHFKMVTGRPCPACGTTRLFQQVIYGHIRGGFAQNPFFFSVLALLFAWALGGLLGRIAGRDVVVELPEPERKWLWIAAAAGLAVNWIYLLCWGRS